MRKNKKLLLGGLSVLTLVAAGSGAVSTFAWYSATQGAVGVGTTSAVDTTTIAVAKTTINDVTVPLKATLVSDGVADGKQLVMAHFNGTDNSAAAPKLTTGYVDASSNFHELGYNASHEPVLTGVQVGTWDDDGDVGTPEVAKTAILHAQMTIKISINYAYTGDAGAWSGESGSKVWTPAGGGVAIGETEIVAGLNAKSTKANWRVGVKASEGSAIRFYATTAASGDPDKNGMDALNTNYGKLAATTDTISFSRSNAGSDSGFTVVANYYVWGGDASASGSTARNDGNSNYSTTDMDVYVDYYAG